MFHVITMASFLERLGAKTIEEAQKNWTALGDSSGVLKVINENKEAAQSRIGDE